MKCPGLTLVAPPAMLFALTALHAAEPAERAATAPSTNDIAVVQRAPETPPPPRHMTEKDILARFDKNGDGKLDDAEREAAHETMLKEQEGRKEERKEARKAAGDAEPVRKRMLEMFDKNHDGKLDDAERAEARQSLRAGAAQGGRPIRDEILRRYDKNGDGKLDDAEWNDAAPALRERVENAPRQLQRWDKNGDGKLDDAEWAEAEKQIRQMIDSPRSGAPGAGGASKQP